MILSNKRDNNIQLSVIAKDIILDPLDGKKNIISSKDVFVGGFQAGPSYFANNRFFLPSATEQTNVTVCRVVARLHGYELSRVLHSYYNKSSILLTENQIVHFCSKYYQYSENEKKSSEVWLLGNRTSFYFKLVDIIYTADVIPLSNHLHVSISKFQEEDLYDGERTYIVFAQ